MPMFTMVDPYDYTALQKLEDLFNIHCGCAVRPSEYCPVHNAKVFIEVVEKKVLGLEKELEEAKREVEEVAEKEMEDLEETTQKLSDRVEDLEKELESAKAGDKMLPHIEQAERELRAMREKLTGEGA